MDKYNTVLKRFAEQNINVDGKFILVDNLLNGEPISGYTMSKDKRWICCPVHNEEFSNVTGNYEYSPQCFEVEDIYNTFLGDGDILHQTKVIVLKRP